METYQAWFFFLNSVNDHSNGTTTGGPSTSQVVKECISVAIVTIGKNSNFLIQYKDRNLLA